MHAGRILLEMHLLCSWRFWGLGTFMVLFVGSIPFCPELFRRRVVESSPFLLPGHKA